MLRNGKKYTHENKFSSLVDDISRLKITLTNPLIKSLFCLFPTLQIQIQFSDSFQTYR